MALSKIQKDFWQKIVEEKDKHQIIGGKCYYAFFDENSTNRAFQGMDGLSYNIRNLTTGEAQFTNDLWCQGEIPDEFREQLPNTHEFVWAKS